MESQLDVSSHQVMALFSKRHQLRACAEGSRTHATTTGGGCPASRYAWGITKSDKKQFESDSHVPQPLPGQASGLKCQKELARHDVTDPKGPKQSTVKETHLSEEEGRRGAA